MTLIRELGIDISRKYPNTENEVSRPRLSTVCMYFAAVISLAFFGGF